MKYPVWLLGLMLVAGCQHTPSRTDATTPNQAKQLTVTPNQESTINTGAMPVVTANVALADTPIALPVKPPANPQQVDDLWQRIAMQFSLGNETHKRIVAQRNWYQKHPGYMRRVTKRAQPFMHLIVEQIEQQNLPLELALLPIVESAFDPFAYSHGRAAGLWQFIPGTGKRFGLRQSWWYDGRRDVLASTQAALAYLTYLHRYFDGDWLHALAAYNSGEGRVRRAILANQKAGKNTDFWALDLPKETRAYVPKLLALKQLLLNKDSSNFVFPLIKNEQRLSVVPIASQIDLAFAADLAGISLDALHAINPGFNRWATDPNGPHRLLLPLDNATTFTQALAKVDDSQRLNWTRHKVKSGESLLLLAKKYHTSVDIIKKINNLTSNTIRAGKHLLIPVALLELDEYRLSADQRLVALQQQHPQRSKIDYRVQAGDTLWDISRLYKVSHRQLAKWNAMAPGDTLRPGQKLVIWLAKPAHQGVVREVNYQVKNGDSLAVIAKRFKVKLGELVNWNQLDLNKYLQPGQTLKIFVNVTQG